MKKLLVLFTALILAGSFAFAQDTGFSAGVEFGIVDANKPNDADDVYPYLMPMLIYENSFLNDALDVYAELDYTIGFTKEYDKDAKKVNPQELYFDLKLGYNLSLGAGTTLSFLLMNENTFYIAPKYNGINFFDGWLTPGVKFTQTTAFGDFYAQGDFALCYRPVIKDDDFASGLNFIAGWDSNFGLGIKLKEYNALTPDIEWFTGFDATVFYETGPIYAEVEANFPKKIDEGGVAITPWLEYYFGSFTFYGFCTFAGVGADGDVGISPGIGLKFNF